IPVWLLTTGAFDVDIVGVKIVIDSQDVPKWHETYQCYFSNHSVLFYPLMAFAAPLNVIEAFAVVANMLFEAIKTMNVRKKS
ncbi:hypothetical protein C5167_033818, partial [Papaver somniferum]